MTSPLRCASFRLLAGAFVLTAGGCSVAANLGADELMSEVDGIVRLEGQAPDVQLRYATTAQVSRWHTRVPLFWPLQPPLRLVFGRTTEVELDNPRAHVRELLLELPDEVGRDPEVVAKAAIRLGWVAQLERHGQTRLVALDGLGRLVRALGLSAFAGDPARFGAAADAPALASVQAAIQAARPDVRPVGGCDAATWTAYRDALRRWPTLACADGVARLLRLEQLTSLWLAETDDAARADGETAMRAALVAFVEELLLEIVQGRSAEYVDLRLCAMEQVRALGGPATVPLLLAAMAATPEQRARGESPYDPDPLIQLRLFHYCGQLGGALADATVRLPGRQGFEVLSPRDFLAIAILNEPAYYSKLRTPALVALTWSLQRPRLDPDPSWVRAWREQRR